MESFELTKGMMEAAKTYMPLSTKQVLAQQIAFACIRPMKRVKWDGIHSLPPGEEGAQDSASALPDLMEEDIAMKMCLLQNVLLSYYFDVEMDEEEDGFAQYDRYAGSHLMNQLERFKSDRDVKNKAFDLTEDFREFRKMVDTLIYNYKMNANDPLKRFDAMLTVFSTPENLRAILKELEAAGTDMKEKVGKAAKKGTKKDAKVLETIPEA